MPQPQPEPDSLKQCDTDLINDLLKLGFSGGLYEHLHRLQFDSDSDSDSDSDLEEKSEKKSEEKAGRPDGGAA